MSDNIKQEYFRQNSKSFLGAGLGYLSKEYSDSPYYGEDEITGFRIDFGYDLQSEPNMED